MSTPATNRRERPRSARAHDAVLVATSALLREGGLPAATVDAISARSGVSKATIYKHWPTRIAVAAEAFSVQMAAAIPLADTGSAAGDLTEHSRRLSAFYASPDGGVFAELLAACVTDPSGAEYFRSFFLDGRREAMRTLWRRAVDRDEVDPSIDVEIAIDMFAGPLIFRRLTGHADLNQDHAEAVAQAALRGLLKT